MDQPPDPREVIQRLVRQHPRWDPLRLQAASDAENITVNGLRFTVGIENDGFYVQVLLPAPIELRTRDGLFQVDDIPVRPGRLIAQYMPNLNLQPHYAPYAFRYVNRLRTMLMLFIPRDRFDIFLFDPTWIWNEFIPQLIATDDEARHQGARFFNIWATFGDDNDIRYHAVGISLAKSRVVFTMELPGGFRHVAQCHFHMQAASLQEITLVTLNIAEIAGVQSGNVWGIVRGGVILAFDEVTKILTFSMLQTPEIKQAILAAFQIHLWADETQVRSIDMGEGHSRIVPFQYCTRLGEAMNTIVQVIMQDNQERIRFSAINGFQLMQQPFGLTAMVRLPVVPLKQQILINLLKQLQALEAIPMRDRTEDNWKEMERLITTMRFHSERSAKLLECVICQGEAKVQSRVDKTPFCSKACAWIHMKSNRNK